MRRKVGEHVLYVCDYTGIPMATRGVPAPFLNKRICKRGHYLSYETVYAALLDEHKENIPSKLLADLQMMSDKNITPAPRREQLKWFGGSMSCDEYCKEACLQSNMVEVLLIPAAAAAWSDVEVGMVLIMSDKPPAYSVDDYAIVQSAVGSVNKLASQIFGHEIVGDVKVLRFKLEDTRRRYINISLEDFQHKFRIGAGDPKHLQRQLDAAEHKGIQDLELTRPCEQMRSARFPLIDMRELKESMLKNALYCGHVGSVVGCSDLTVAL